MNKLFAALIIIAVLLLYPGDSMQAGVEQQAGIDEKLGQHIPPDLNFVDESSGRVLSKDLFTRPVILSLIYYNCRHICPELLTGLTEALDAMDLEEGKDFSLVTVSFDETDTPELALKTKDNYVTLSKKEYRNEAWKFLTGDKENIMRLTEAAGFRFKREKDRFTHPSSLIILSPEGKITRYLYGTTFLPRDLAMAVYEASEGRSGKSVGRLLLYCFSYDPEGRTYVFNILKVTGTVTILFAITFILYLNVSSRSFRIKR
ncbi:MAG: SCO family protein [Nitrospiraceae bacterium]|nr:MAG: SCO family protein [Nitrospiraceae bacterium]